MSIFRKAYKELGGLLECLASLPLLGLVHIVREIVLDVDNVVVNFIGAIEFPAFANYEIAEA